MNKLLTFFSLVFSICCFAQDQRLWATYYGGDEVERGFGIAADKNGNVYITGYTASLTGIASGGFQNTYGGGDHDAFLAKFDSSGNRLWATYYGGEGNDEAYSVETDNRGNVYLTGTTTSLNSIASAGAFQQICFGGNITYGDAFLVKFDSSGNRLWATYLGGTGEDRGYMSAIDTSGNIYMIGPTTSNSNIASGGFQNTYAGSSDAYLVKFDSTGNRVWGTYFGGSGFDSGSGVCIDNNENIYLSGFTASTSGITVGGFQPALAGGSDGFIVKFNPLGVKMWSTYYGGNAFDNGFDVEADAQGNVYLSGYTASSTGIASGGFQNQYGGGSYDAFIVKFTNSGFRVWATYYGGEELDYGKNIEADAEGSIYLSGATQSLSGIGANGFYNSIPALGSEFVAKFNSSGNRLCASYYGGNYSLGRVAVDAFGNTYLAGSTNNTSGVAYTGFQNSFAGGQSDAYFVKFTSCNFTLSAEVNSDLPACDEQCTASASVSAQFGVLPYTFLWSDSSTAATVTQLCPGTYSVTVTDGADSSVTLSVTIDEGLNIPITITQNADTLTATTSPNYQWYHNDTLIPGATSQHYIITQSGYYYVTTTQDGCSFTANTLETTCICVGIDENEFSKKISLYPNPATTFVTLSVVEGLTLNGELKIMNAQGQLVLSSIFDIQRSTFDISSLSTGLYYLTLQSNEGVGVKRFEVLR